MDPSAGLIRVLTLAYQLVQVIASNSSVAETNPAANNFVKTVLDSLLTLTPTCRGLPSAVALLASYIDALFQKGALTVEEVIAILKGLEENGQVIISRITPNQLVESADFGSRSRERAHEGRTRAIYEVGIWGRKWSADPATYFLRNVENFGLFLPTSVRAANSASLNSWRSQFSD